MDHRVAAPKQETHDCCVAAWTERTDTPVRPLGAVTKFAAWCKIGHVALINLDWFDRLVSGIESVAQFPLPDLQVSSAISRLGQNYNLSPPANVILFTSEKKNAKAFATMQYPLPGTGVLQFYDEGPFHLQGAIDEHNRMARIFGAHSSTQVNHRFIRAKGVPNFFSIEEP
jgi:hypothetical protein